MQSHVEYVASEFWTSDSFNSSGSWYCCCESEYSGSWGYNGDEEEDDEDKEDDNEDLLSFKATIFGNGDLYVDEDDEDEDDDDDDEDDDVPGADSSLSEPYNGNDNKTAFKTIYFFIKLAS